MKVDIPFNDWSKERLLAGRKFATSRNKKYGCVGDFFEAFGWRWKITSVKKIPLKIVSCYLYEIEGSDTPMEFISIWDEIHPIKKYDPEHMVWVHFFAPDDLLRGEKDIIYQGGGGR